VSSISQENKCGTKSHPLRLLRIAGPPFDPIELSPKHSAIVGRSSGCEVQLADPMISRRHARIERSGEEWLIEDLGSRHGAEINGVRLSADSPVLLRDFDQLSIGPWTFSVRVSPDPAIGESTIDTSGTDREGRRVETVVSGDLQSLAKERLDLIMDCAAAIHAVSSITELADHVLDVAVAGTGYSRAALAKPIESFDTVELLGCRDKGGGKGRDIIISRTMLREAAKGDLVRMADDSHMREAMSIISMGISSAICCPVVVGRRILAYLYLDTLGDSGGVQPDATSFCHAIARMTGMAMSSLERAMLERRQAKFDAELVAAREAQRRIMPPDVGEVGPIRYAMRSNPGRVIAGDLFDVTPIDGDRTAFFLGDVVGKGMPAAMLMSMTQTNLAAALQHGADLTDAIGLVNRLLHARSADNEFVTLFAAIYNGKTRTLECIDAGHGYCLLRNADGSIHRPEFDGGLPLGIDAGGEYRVERIEGVEPGRRLVIFSDGVVEQCDPSSEEFGVERAIRVLENSADVGADVAMLLDAVIEHAQSRSLSDDVTIASIQPR